MRRPAFRRRRADVSPPRVGLLSYITEEFRPGTGRDIVFIPIGLNYDWIIEDVNVTRFETSQFQSKGRIYVLLQGIQFTLRVAYELIRRRQRFGLHCSKFGRPISFESWLDARGVNWGDIGRAERFTHISELGRRLTSDITHLVPATPMSVLCRLWMEEPGLSVGRQDALARYSRMVRRLEEGGMPYRASPPRPT